VSGIDRSARTRRWQLQIENQSVELWRARVVALLFLTASAALAEDEHFLEPWDAWDDCGAIRRALAGLTAGSTHFYTPFSY
jgi:hypothetical protein